MKHNEATEWLAALKSDVARVNEALKGGPGSGPHKGGGIGSGNGDGGSGKLSAGDKGEGIAQRSFAGEKLMTGKDSLADNLVADGKGGWKLNEATQARLDSRIAEATKGIPKSEDPTMHMLGGGPAAGKSNADAAPKTRGCRLGILGPWDNSPKSNLRR